MADNPEEDFIKYTKLLQQDPNNAMYHLQAANSWLIYTHEDLPALRKRREYLNELEIHFQRAIELEPKNGYFHSEYAIFLFWLRENPEKSYEEFEMAINLEPKNTIIIVEYASLLSHNKQLWGKTEEMFQKAIKIDPMDIKAVHQYYVFLRNGKKNLTQALPYLKRCMEIAPDNKDILHEFEKIQKKTGKKNH